MGNVGRQSVLGEVAVDLLQNNYVQFLQNLLQFFLVDRELNLVLLRIFEDVLAD